MKRNQCYYISVLEPLSGLSIYYNGRLMLDVRLMYIHNCNGNLIFLDDNDEVVVIRDCFDIRVNRCFIEED